MEYVLIFWPDVQNLMEYDWFREECYLLNPLEDQEHYDSAYAVPKHRLHEVLAESEFMRQLYDVILRSK